jgi:two-component system, NarL family, sensor histidine kinase DevS
MASAGAPSQSPGPGHDADILRERDRIAAELQNEVIQRVVAIGLNLQNTAAMTIDPLVRRRVGQAVDDLDHLVQVIRNTVFDLEDRLRGRGLRT